jgi:hypothetical protein
MENVVFTLHIFYSDHYCRYINTGTEQTIFIYMYMYMYIQDNKTQQEHTYMYIMYL